MTKWHTLSAQFNDEQMEKIKGFMKKMGFEKPSQVIRYLVLASLISKPIFEKASGHPKMQELQSDLFKKVEDFGKELFADPEYRKKWERGFAEIRYDLGREISEEDMFSFIMPFLSNRPGRPPDVGI